MPKRSAKHSSNPVNAQLLARRLQIRTLVGQRLRAARLHREFSMAGVAATLSLTTTSLYHYETAKRSIPLDTFLLLCEELHASPREILGDCITGVSQ